MAGRLSAFHVNLSWHIMGPLARINLPTQPLLEHATYNIPCFKPRKN